MVLAAAEEKISYTCQDFGSAGHVTVVKWLQVMIGGAVKGYGKWLDQVSNPVTVRTGITLPWYLYLYHLPLEKPIG
jgi:hypothetical protein